MAVALNISNSALLTAFWLIPPSAIFSTTSFTFPIPPIWFARLSVFISLFMTVMKSLSSCVNVCFCSFENIFSMEPAFNAAFTIVVFCSFLVAFISLASSRLFASQASPNCVRLRKFLEMQLDFLSGYVLDNSLKKASLCPYNLASLSARALQKIANISYDWLSQS